MPASNPSATEHALHVKHGVGIAIMGTLLFAVAADAAEQKVMVTGSMASPREIEGPCVLRSCFRKTPRIWP
jgi:hypothetical protein